VLIAGASGGIGKFLAEHICSQDIQVFGTYNTHDSATSLPYGMAKVDFTNELQVSNWINEVATEKDDLCLFYCVGLNYNCMMHKSDSVRWKEVINTNLIGVQYVLRHVLPLMRSKRFGRIILFSSVVPQVGVPGTSAYAASKAALWGVSRAVAMENANFGITLNTVNLGYFDIGMIKDVPQELLDSIIKNIPIGRLGDPVNILKTVLYLIDTDYVTGTEININGGLF